MARGARAIFVALCLLTLAKIVLACDAAHYLNSIRAGDADAVSLCLTSGLVVRPIRDEVCSHSNSNTRHHGSPSYCCVCVFLFPQNGLSGLQLAVKLGHKQVGLLIAKHALASLRVHGLVLHE